MTRRETSSTSSLDFHPSLVAALLALSAAGCGSLNVGTGNVGTGDDHGTSEEANHRPYISLKDYEAASRSSAAYVRLKTEIDDVVADTEAVAAGATYDQLVTALNAQHYGYSVVDAVILYRLTGDEKYIRQAIRMMDLYVTSENARIAADANPVIAGDSYLEVGHYIEQLALTYDHGYGFLSAAQRAAWAAFAEQTLYNVWNPDSAAWGSRPAPWSGWSIDDPGNNYHFSFLKATKLWALAAKSDTWKGFLAANKFGPLNTYYAVLTGGGSREGTGYGTAHKNLFENYRYWKASTGEDLSVRNTHARDTIDYWIHATVPTRTHYAPIGDQARSSNPAMFDYQRHLVQEAVALNAGTAQARRGAWWLGNVPVSDGGSGWLYGRMRYKFNYRYDLLASGETAEAPTALLYDATGVGALFARSDWTTSASWVAINAGPYDQSHAHQDQGSFTFHKGDWLAVTANIWTDSGINQGTDMHNVIRFMSGGTRVPQNESVSSKTVTDAGGVVTVQADLSNAYSSNSSLVSSWTRELVYARAAHSLRIHDVCTVGAGVTPIFQVVVPVAPTVSGVVVTAGNLRITPVTPAAPTINVQDMSALGAEFNSGYRVELTAASGCEFEVLLEAL